MTRCHVQQTACCVTIENCATQAHHKNGNQSEKFGERVGRSLVASRASRAPRVRYASDASATRPHSLPNLIPSQLILELKPMPVAWLVAGSCVVRLLRSRFSCGASGARGLSRFS